jgi:hypothetical protein
MTVGRFLSLIREENFEVKLLRLRPIRRFGWLVALEIFREYFTSAVICALAKKDSTSQAE